LKHKKYLHWQMRCSRTEWKTSGYSEVWLFNIISRIKTA